MDEFIEILNPDGSFSGKSILKSEAHEDGVFHASAHIWICNQQNEILLQKRIATKKTFPNLWDVSVAGHISFGESPLTSAIREIKEEVGLNITEDELQPSGTFQKKVSHTNGIIDHELHHIYVCKIEFELKDLIPQASEVSELKMIPFNSFIEVTEKQDFVPHGKAYFNHIKKALQKIL